jgi:hypothetical protein
VLFEDDVWDCDAVVESVVLLFYEFVCPHGCSVATML